MAKEVYTRELPEGRYCIKTVVGQANPEWMNSKFLRSDEKVEILQFPALKTRLGLRLEMQPDVLRKVKFNRVYGDDDILDFLLAHPHLAITGCLAGYKMYHIAILECDGRTILSFCDTWSNRIAQVRLWTGSEDKPTYPGFVTYAMSENGLTKYEFYMDAQTGKPTIWEKSALHERTVILEGNNLCTVEEIILPGSCPMREIFEASGKILTVAAF